MNDVVTTTKQVWEKVLEGDITAFTLTDVVWAVGIVVLLVLAVKIGYKMAKVFLVILLIAAILFYLVSQGVIPWH